MKDTLTLVATFFSAVLLHMLMALVIQVIWNFGLHREIQQIPQLSYTATLAAYSIIKLVWAPANTHTTDT